MTYDGSSQIFAFDPIDRDRGVSVPRMVVGHGRFVYYPSEEGFFLTDGTQSYPIGENKVDRTFYNQFDTNNAYRCSAAIDPLNKLVAFAFPSSTGVGKIFFFYWPERKWSEAEVDVDALVNTTSESLTLEDLDSISSSIDALGISLDSAQFRGGGLLFGAFNTAHQLAYFDGDLLAATLETGEVEFNQGFYTRVSKLRPLIDGGTIKASVGGRDRQVDPIVYGPSNDLDVIGEIGADDEHHYHRIRCNISAGGDWTHAQGVQVMQSRMGMGGFT